VQHGRGRTDRRKPAVLLVVAQHDGSYARIAAKNFRTWSAWQKQAIERLVFDGRDVRIRMHRQPASPGDVDALAQGSHGDVGACTSQKIDWRCRLYFFKAVSQERQNRGHALEQSSMSMDEHSFLNPVGGKPVLQ
jgi:hypothetical protein